MQNDLKGAAYTVIWDGTRDTSNFYSDKYLQVNSCGIQRRDKGLTVLREHGRKDYHIVLMMEGECLTEYDGIAYTMKRGDYILFPPNTKHFYSYTSSNLSFWCHFTGTAVNEILQQCDIKPGLSSFTNDQRVAESFYDLLRLSYKPTDATLVNSTFLRFLHNISQGQPRFSDINDRRIAHTLNYIHKNYANEMTLDMLANRSGYSKSRFASIFKAVTGYSPMQYLNKIRLGFAADLLLSTKLSVREIATSCGFNDPLYFSRAFHKNFKCSPSEYASITKSIMNIKNSEQ